MSAEFDSFLNLYHVAFKKLLKRLEKLPKNERISVEKYVQQLVDEAVSSLNQNLLDHIPTIVNSSYVDGAKAVTTALGKTSGTIGTTLNTRLMRLLAENTVDQLQEAHHLFGRRTMDRVRDIGISQS